jgi:hypothetical protein
MGVRERLIYILIGMLVTCSLLPIWCVKYPPLQDYPQHLAAAHILRNYNNPKFDYHRNFRINLLFVPGVLFELLVALLNVIFPIEIAGKIGLSLYIVFFPISLLYFLSRVESNRKYLAFFAFPYLFNFFFNIGFTNFCLGVPLTFFALGYWCHRGERLGIKQLLSLTGFSILIYFAHLITFAVFLWSLLTLSLFSEKRWRKLLLIIASVMPSLLLFTAYWFKSESQSLLHNRLEYTDLYGTLLTFMLAFYPYRGFLGMLIFFLPTSLFLFSAFYSLFKERETIFSLKTGHGQLFLLWISFLILFFLLPLHTPPGGYYANIRLAIFIFFIGLAWIQLPKDQTLHKLITVLLVILSITSIAYTYHKYSSLQDEFRDYLSGIKYINWNSRLLPLIVQQYAEKFNTKPFLHAWAYYHIAKGGVGPYFFARLSYHPILYRRNRRMPAPGEGFPERFSSEGHSQPYDFILLWGGTSKIRQEVKRRFELIHSQGKIELYARRKRDDSERSKL